MTDNWRGQAACNSPDVDPSWFDTDDRGTRPIQGLRICQGCPVRMDCFLEALDTPTSDDDGVWGGTTPGARRLVRQKHMSVARAFANGDHTAGLRTDQERQDDVLKTWTDARSIREVATGLSMSWRDVKAIVDTYELDEVAS